MAWAIKEFSLEGVDPGLLGTLDGREMCAVGKEAFLAKTPPYSGDILWEHLDIMQKGELSQFLVLKFVLRASGRALM